MLHVKAPRKILSLDDGTFPALLKTLSDPSEEVIKSDLTAACQISSASSEEYFTSFMINLVQLFSTDPLLELRGRDHCRAALRQLEHGAIYRTSAEILERDEVRRSLTLSFHLTWTYDSQDLEFASLMVQNLNLFLITLPSCQTSVTAKEHRHQGGSL